LDLTDNDLQHIDYHPDTIKASREQTPLACQQDIHYQNRRCNQLNAEHLSPNFGFVPSLRIQHTLDNTPQFAWLDTLLPLRKHFKSPFSAASVIWLKEVVANDTYVFDTLVLDGGLLGHGSTTMVQQFCLS
jgi:hypothetical protein